MVELHLIETGEHWPGIVSIYNLEWYDMKQTTIGFSLDVINRVLSCFDGSTYDGISVKGESYRYSLNRISNKAKLVLLILNQEIGTDYNNIALIDEFSPDELTFLFEILQNISFTVKLGIYKKKTFSNKMKFPINVYKDYFEITDYGEEYERSKHISVNSIDKLNKLSENWDGLLNNYEDKILVKKSINLKTGDVYMDYDGFINLYIGKNDIGETIFSRITGLKLEVDYHRGNQIIIMQEYTKKVNLIKYDVNEMLHGIIVAKQIRYIKTSSNLIRDLMFHVDETLVKNWVLKSSLLGHTDKNAMSALFGTKSI